MFGRATTWLGQENIARRFQTMITDGSAPVTNGVQNRPRCSGCLYDEIRAISVGPNRLVVGATRVKCDAIGLVSGTAIRGVVLVAVVPARGQGQACD